MSTVEISLCKSIRKEDLLNLLERQKIFPYDYIRGITKEQFISYMYKEIKNCSGKNVNFFVAYNKNQVQGLLILQLLPWDSTIFGFPCARIKYILANESDTDYEIKLALISKMVAWAKEHAIQFIDVHISPIDLHGIKALTKNHFNLIATHIHHVWDFRNNFVLERTHHIPIRIATLDDLPKLEQLTEKFIPPLNRFFLDEKIRNTNKVPVMFHEWLKNSLLGRAKCFLVAEIDNQIVGYTTVTVDEEIKHTLGVVIGDVELTGVISDSQNRGVCLDMITFAVHWAQANKLDIMEGVIHISNSPANVVPPKLNARMLGAHHTFHWHAD
ncbi:MAG TPA: hypothetical protein PLT82_07975 [Candidatus Hydrogenedens sp.]|nr:hypothetical protein [Candidatus Hydrogenedens sp.]HPP59053.1 hypothetical protein [Candidatus Hydrogenedens sp.]